MEKFVYVDKSSDIKPMFEIVRPLYHGNEGMTYLTKDNKVVKVLFKKCPTITKEEEKDDIIMQQDFDLDSFYFPETLFISDGKIVGYTSRYFGNSTDPFTVSHTKNASTKNDFSRINFAKIFDAREKLFRDLITLSEGGVLLNDVTSNILYDKTKFGIVDTLHYRKEEGVTLEQNIKIVDEAILYELGLYNENFIPNYNESLEKNIQRIRLGNYRR